MLPDSAASDVEPAVPPLAGLVPDATRISRCQQAAALLRPWAALVLVGLLSITGWWIGAITAGLMVFGSNVAVVHDLLHRNLGFSKRVNDALLALYGLLLLNSGHALAATHRRHHRSYPSAEDPEGYLDDWPVWRVLVEGPVFRLRLWGWALRHGGRARAVMGAEMVACAGAWCFVLGWGTTFPSLQVYVATVELGTWLFPLVGINAVHDHHERGRHRQTRSIHHRWARLGLGLQYHLEHHLYPQVPACRLDEVATALEPWLREHDAAVYGDL